MSAHKIFVGYLVQLSGIAAFALGVVLSLRHIVIGASFIGGAVAFFVGRKIRDLA